MARMDKSNQIEIRRNRNSDVLGDLRAWAKSKPPEVQAIAAHIDALLIGCTISYPRADWKRALVIEVAALAKAAGVQQA